MGFTQIQPITKLISFKDVSIFGLTQNLSKNSSHSLARTPYRELKYLDQLNMLLRNIKTVHNWVQSRTL